MNKRKKRDETHSDDILTSINELVKLRKSEMSNPVEPSLTYQSMYLNLDRMLKKLPEEIVEDLNVKFVNLTHDALKKFETIFTLVNEISTAE